MVAHALLRAAARLVSPLVFQTIEVAGTAYQCRLSRLPAGRRNDAVHAQVHDSLPVMIESVPHEFARNLSARRFTSIGWNHLVEILLGERPHGFVAIMECILQILDVSVLPF